MPADQLLRDRVERIVDAKLAFFRRHLREEDGLEHQVAEFFGQTRPIALIDGVEDLVGFFQQIRLDGVEVLFAIPRAAARSAQPRHDADQALETFSSCAWILWHCWKWWKFQSSKTASSWAGLRQKKPAQNLRAGRKERK